MAQDHHKYTKIYIYPKSIACFFSDFESWLGYFKNILHLGSKCLLKYHYFRRNGENVKAGVSFLRGKHDFMICAAAAK